jgi:hypothetical protein
MEYMATLNCSIARSTFNVVGCAVAISTGSSHAAEVASIQAAEIELPTLTVTANYQAAIGTTDAASSGIVTTKLIQSRPTLRTGEVLEFVPGVIVAQHSGDGKANQYYLRGFNLDHGTDFVTLVDGMQVNAPTHAHSHGYSDLNFLIPELLQSIQYHKGVYAAEDGDFSSAGSARLNVLNALPKGIASWTAGSNSYQRALLANSTAWFTGTLLYGVDLSQNDGPWQTPEGLRKQSGILRYSRSDSDSSQSLTAMAYSARWRSTDQVPTRALADGSINRFGSVDPSDRGETNRVSLSWNGSYDDGVNAWHSSLYALRSTLDLYSNFTYYLDDPINGDQLEQQERRTAIGGALSRSWTGLQLGQDGTVTIGAQWRHDSLSPVGLYTAKDGHRTGVTQVSDVRSDMLGFYAQDDFRLAPWFRAVAGGRLDQSSIRVRSTTAANSGSNSAWLLSPKLSLIFGPWSANEFFFNMGSGFHSNDARGQTAKLDPKTGESASASAAFARTRGSEVGWRNEWIQGLQSSLTFWQLSSESELVFVGDAGATEASGASRRHGVEWNNHYTATKWLILDADLAMSRARFNADQGDAPNVGRYVPGAVTSVATLGLSIRELGAWFGQFQWRFFGPRALTEDNSVKSKATSLSYVRLGYKLTPSTKLTVDVFNLFNQKVSDIDYYYVSRLPLETASGVAGLHTHPAEPRSMRMTLTHSF